MNKLALSVAAMLLASSAAFAGSDHFGADKADQPAVDSNATASITYLARQDGVDAQVTTGPTKVSVQDIIAEHNRDSNWGR